MKTKKPKRIYVEGREYFRYKSRYCNDNPNEILAEFKEFLEEKKSCKKIKNIEYGIEEQNNYYYVPESDESYEKRLAEHNKELENKKAELEKKASELGLKIKPVKDIVLNRTRERIPFPELPNNVSFNNFCDNLINFLEQHKDYEVESREKYICMTIFVRFDCLRLENDFAYDRRVYQERMEKAKLKRTEKENKIRELKALARQIGADLVKA
jgi:hypothetical protein